MLLENLGSEVGINQEAIESIKILKYFFKEPNYFLKTGFVFKVSSELKGNFLRYDLIACISFLGNEQHPPQKTWALTFHQRAGRPWLCLFGFLFFVLLSVLKLKVDIKK